MQNIIEILKEQGIELTDEQQTAVNKGISENYKTIAEHDKKVGKLEAERDNYKTQLDTASDTLKEFEGLDAEGIKKKTVEYETAIKELKENHEKELSERDFEDILKDSISKANGINEKAIRALLDVESLKVSNNQKDDVTNAIKSLVEAEDSKMLFKEADADVVDKADLIGKITSKGGTALTGVEKAFMERNPGLEI